MTETQTHYEDRLKTVDVKGDGVPDSQRENLIKNRAREYVLKEKRSLSADEFRNLVDRVDGLLRRQDIERIDLGEALKEDIRGETKERLNKEILVHEARGVIYKELGIQSDMQRNNPFKNFLKGMVDEGIIGNYELAIQVLNTNGKILIESLKQLVSWEGLKNIAQSFGKSIDDLFDGNAYERGKSVVSLGLITAGLGAGFAIGKKGLKLGIKKMGGHIGKTESSLIKGVSNSGERKNIAQAIDRNKFDFLEMRGTYMLGEKPHLKVMEAGNLIEEFSGKIDIRYLVNHPERMDDMLDIIESMCEYVEGNSDKILSLNTIDLRDFQSAFKELRNKVDELEKSPILLLYKADLVELREGKLRATILKINPHLSPKK